MIEQEETGTIEEALEAGYFGVKTDPLPNEVYTVAGAAAKQRQWQEAENIREREAYLRRVRAKSD